MSRTVDWPDLPAVPRASLPRHVAPLRPPTLSWSDLGVSLSGTGKRPSAVVMLFIRPAADGAPARLVFMRRSTKVRSHKGQVSFAGGKAEVDDPSPAATALRELEEELGVARELVTPVGLLPSEGALDRHLVTPVVAVAPVGPEDLVASPDEVASVFVEPWPALAGARAQEFRFNIFGNWRQSYLFVAPGGSVWGLTARMLQQAALA